MSQNLYYFCVAGIFKNEATSLQEWIEHYIFHGAQHFFLLNDKSTDNFIDVLTPYLQQNIVTLIHIDEPYYQGRQKNIYNKHLLPLLNQQIMKWLFICDIDEFLWSSREIDLKNILKHIEHIGQIQIDCNFFGSNGLEKQPKYIIPNFTRRATYPENLIARNYKYIINSNFQFINLGVHTAYFENEEYMKNKCFQRIDYSCDQIQPWFIINHYNIQSKDFWTKIKMTRGDADHCRERTIQNFFDGNKDTNQIEDLGLFLQNKILYDKLIIEHNCSIDTRIELS